MIKITPLDPKEYPEITAKCGCKSIDGTVTHMCDFHWNDMHKDNSDCKHENITADEIYGEQFCEDCASFVDKE